MPRFYLPGDDGEEPLSSPWLALPWGGYERIAAADTGGWYQMLNPGATGWGLMVCYHSPHQCCTPPGPYGLTLELSADGVTRVPWLLPAMVTWASAIHPDTEVAVSGILGPDAPDWRDGPFGPPVAITDSWFVDGGRVMARANLAGDEESMWDEGTWGADVIGPVSGVAVPWQIVPVSYPIAEQLLESLSSAAETYATHVLAYGNCDMGNNHGEDDYWFECHCQMSTPEPCDTVSGGPDAIKCGCYFVLGDEHCRCGESPTFFQQHDAIMSSDLGARDFIPDHLHPLWEHAVERYIAGFRTIYQNMEAGDVWSSSSWRRLSPFSDTHSLEVLARQPSPRSTSSPTARAS